MIIMNYVINTIYYFEQNYALVNALPNANEDVYLQKGI